MGYSSIAIAQAENTDYYGSLSSFDAHATIKGPCGDTMDFWLLIKNNRIDKISFTTDGCVSSRACGSMTCIMAQGKYLDEAFNISQEMVLDALGEFPESSAHCALLATNTLKAAIQEYKGILRINQIKNKILITSGKGGVGKSTVAVHIAKGLVDKGYKVGLLDVDLHGPSIPALLGISVSGLLQGSDGLIPVDMEGLKVMSIGFLLKSSDDAVAWRGPRKHAVIRQFLREVEWGDLDYLIIDSPPGTGDELMSVYQNAGILMGAIVVTTPQKIAAYDVRKSITFCKDLKIPILGLVENMSGFICPKCGEQIEFFPKGAVNDICKEMNVICIGSIPMNRELARAADLGQIEPISAEFLKIINHLIKEKK